MAPRRPATAVSMPPALPEREAAIQAAAVDLLVRHAFGVVVHKQGARVLEKNGKKFPTPLGAETHAQGLSAKKIRGYPDLEVLVGFGKVVWLETKSENGALSDVQREWHAFAKAQGLEIHVYRNALHALQICQAARARAKDAA